MSNQALFLMVFSMVFLWGGLAMAIIHLLRHPDHEDDTQDDA